MNVYAHNLEVPDKDKNLDNVVVSLRLRGADAVRYWKVMDTAKARNPYIDKSHIIRELLGLDPPNLLTKDEVSFFRGREEDTELVNAKVPVVNIKLRSEKGEATRKQK